MLNHRLIAGRLLVYLSFFIWGILFSQIMPSVIDPQWKDWLVPFLPLAIGLWLGSG